MSNRANRSRPAPQHAGRTPFVLLVLGLLGGGLVLLLGLNTVSAANELRRHDFASRDQSIAASLVELRNAVAASAAPQNLARHAAEYGMVPAGAPAFLVVGPAGSVRVLGSAAPASPIPLPVSSPPHSKKHLAKKHARKKDVGKTTKKHNGPERNAPSKSASATASRSQPASPHSSTPAPTSTSASPRPSSTSPSPAPKPSRTPVPTITLPGGTR